jgi:hypothetical protein
MQAGRLRSHLRTGERVTVSDDEIAELRRLDAEATPPPWEVCPCNKSCRVWPDPAERPVLDGATKADRDFIAAARNMLPRLLSELDRLRARERELEEGLRPFAGAAVAIAETNTPYVMQWRPGFPTDLQTLRDVLRARALLAK